LAHTVTPSTNSNRSLLVPGLLIDAEPESTNPSASSNFCYNIRYRCASLIEDCVNTSVSMEFPDGVEVVSLSSGGNIANSQINNLAGGNTEVIFDLETAGTPTILAAGSSGRLEVCLKWDCLANGGTQMPAAGSSFNFASSPTMFASGTSLQASPSADVTVPTFLGCLPAPSSSGTGLLKTERDMASIVHPGGVSSWALVMPAHTGPLTFYDTIPPNTFFTDYIGQNQNSIELLIGGTWHDIGIGQINSWVESNYNNGTLNNLVASGVSTGASAVLLDVSSTSLGSYYLDGPTAIRITTPAGNNTNASRPLSLYIDPSVAVGDIIQNCFSSSDPSLGRSCDNTNIGNPEATLMRFRKSFGASIGDPYPTNFPYNRVPPITKSNQDLVYALNYIHGNGNDGAKTGLIITDTLPLGFDFIPGVGGNDWRIYLRPQNDINEPFGLDTQPDCETPNFSKSTDPNTGKVVLNWEFSNCAMYGRFNSQQQLDIIFTARYIGTELLGGQLTNCAAAKFSDESLIYCDDLGQEIRGDCPDKITSNIPTIDALVNASKFVQGKLDSVFTRFSSFGDTDSSGFATYELYIYNYGIEGLRKLEIVDILPNIGDYALTTELPRGSQWNATLAGPIELERISIGTTWTDDLANVNGNILYATTYDPCYKDNSGQVKAETGLPEPMSQSCSSTDFSASNPVVGATAFALTWEDAANPILFGEGIRLRFQTQQPVTDPDPNLNEIAWNSFAVTGTQTDDLELFSTEPLKVGARNIDAFSSGLGNLVWLDNNANGRQDIGEPGIENIHVSIYEANGDTVLVGGISLITTTDINGHYEFLGLTPNTDYIIRLDSFTDFNGGGILAIRNLTDLDSPNANDLTDSDAILGDNNGTDTILYPEILATSPSSGSLNNSYDFGFFHSAELCGTAWFDIDGQGGQEVGEPFLDSLIVVLLDQNNIEIARDTTDINGNYFFDNIPPALYDIQIDTSLVTGFIYTLANGIGNDEMDSDSSADGFISGILVESGSVICNNDIGLTLPIANSASISGVVWDELVQDGLRISPEENVRNVQINLLDDLGFVLQTVLTDATGAYEFMNLEPNLPYQIQVFPPANISISSFQDAGSDDTIDSDVDPVTGISHMITPLPDEDITNVDAALYFLYAIGNQVWNDDNNNSIFESGESVFTGLKVYLLDGLSMTKIDSTLTDVNGKYLFTNLFPTDYKIEVEIPSLYRSTLDNPNTPLPNQMDNDENGIGINSTGTVMSDIVSIASGGGMSGDANWLESDHGQVINGAIDNTSNPKAYYTVDFGFSEASCQFSICLPVTIVRN